MHKQIILKNGEMIFTHTNNEYIASKIDDSKDYYESKILNKWNKFFINATDVFDIGANIGNHSIFWLHNTNSQNIYSFEPLVDNYTILALNHQHQNSERWMIYNLGLSSGHDTVKIQNISRDNMGGTSFISTNDDNEDNIEKFQSLDFFIKNTLKKEIKGRILIKIDTEGFEVKVLNGMTNLLKLEKSMVWVEITKNTWKEVYEILINNGFFLVDIIGMNFLFLKSEQHEIPQKKILVELFNRMK